MSGLVDGDEFPSIPGFPDLPGFNAPSAGSNDSDYGKPGRHGHPAKAAGPKPATAEPSHRAGSSDHRTVQIDRSCDRSAHRRRSAVTERPPNVRPARAIDRGSVGGGFNARRPAPEAHGLDSRGDDNQIANRAYRGNHRAGGQHHFDHQTAAEQRSSRVGRHHADYHDDYFNR